jgi:hypothetical protein
MQRLTGFRKALIIVVAWVFALCSGLGKDAIELQSSYTGNGWFQYRLRTLEDPFFKRIDFSQLVPSPFTNYVENTVAPNWTNFFYQGEWDGIMYDWSVPQPRINEITFSVRSTSTHFRRWSYGFRTIIGFQFADCYEGYLGGYLGIDCLVPCAADETDGSPAVLDSRVEFIPDLKIDALIVTNHQVYGVKFSWDEPSTVELQGSKNMRDWNPVARFWGNPPQSSWSTNVSLSPYGQFFRLLLVANRHITNTLAPTTLASQPQTALDVPIQSQNIIGNQIRIGFASVPKALYEVEYCQLPERTISTRRIEASETFTTLLFDISEPRRAVVFKARQLLP